MALLTAADRRRVADLTAALGTFRDGEGPALRAVLPELRALLRSDVSLAYALRPEEAGVAIDYFHASGMALDRYRSDFQAVLARQPGSVLHYDPFRPEPSQRNRVRILSHESYGPANRQLLSRSSVDHRGLDQLRVLLCEGPSLLAWVGGARWEPFGAREVKVLGALAPALRRRLLLERHLEAGPAALQLLGAALEAIGAPAFLLRGQAVVQANAAGRAMLERDRGRALAALHDHVAGRGDGSFRLTRHSAPGVPAHVLAVASRVPVDAGTRAAAAAARWALTPRQAEVLALVARGLSNKAVAAELRCGEGTVEFHVTALLQKAGCESRAALVARFWTAG